MSDPTPDSRSRHVTLTCQTVFYLPGLIDWLRNVHMTHFWTVKVDVTSFVETGGKGELPFC